MLIFRVCCKLHNFAIRERDPWHDTYGGLGPGQSATLEATDQYTTAPAVRNRIGGNAPQRERRHSWMLQLKAAGLRRRPRRN